MKKLFLIVFILISVQSFSQLVQYPTNYGVIYRRGGADTILQVPSDTFTVPASLISKSHIAIKNGTLYRWNGSAWAGLSGGSTDTASLSNRINLKLNISDTSSMLANYVNGVGYALLKSGQVVRFDSATAAAYFLRIKDSATGTNLNGYLTRSRLSSYNRLWDVLQNNDTLYGDGEIYGNYHAFQIDDANNIYLGAIGVNGDRYSTINLDSSGYTNLGSSLRTSIASIGSVNRRSQISVFPDSINLEPYQGVLKIDTLTYVPGTKALRYNPSTGLVSYADTTSGGSGNYNSNVGSAYRLAIPNTNNIKTLSAKYGITLDSATTNEIGIKADTATLFPAVRATISGVSDSSKFTLQRDTIALASFGAGGGQAGDTTSFSTSTIYGSFYNDGSDTLVITSIRAVLQGSSPSLVPTVYYNDSINVTAGATKLVNSPSALTNTAVGVSSTPDNKKIPPGVWVWVKTETVTTKPTYFSLTLIGYKKRK